MFSGCCAKGDGFSAAAGHFWILVHFGASGAEFASHTVQIVCGVVCDKFLETFGAFGEQRMKLRFERLDSSATRQRAGCH
jgi:hypothetical protein